MRCCDGVSSVAVMPSVCLLILGCSSPGKDGGLRERWNCGVSVPGGWRVPLFGAQPSATGVCVCVCVCVVIDYRSTSSK